MLSIFSCACWPFAPSHPLSPSYPSTFNLPQHQGLFPEKSKLSLKLSLIILPNPNSTKNLLVKDTNDLHVLNPMIRSQPSFSLTDGQQLALLLAPSSLIPALTSFLGNQALLNVIPLRLFLLSFFFFLMLLFSKTCSYLRSLERILGFLF